MTLICGCRGWTHDSAAQDLLRSSSTLQQLTLRQFPHKEQIELYLEAMHRGHPPNIAESQAFLDGLVEGLGSEYQHTWNNKTYYTQMRLNTLPVDGTGELLAALL